MAKKKKRFLYIDMETGGKTQLDLEVQMIAYRIGKKGKIKLIDLTKGDEKK